MNAPTHVHVTILAANIKKIKGKNGYNNPFVAIQLGNDTFQTSIKEKSNMPEWNEDCDLKIPSKRSNLILNVCHHTKYSPNEFIGQVLIPLSNFEDYETSTTLWYPLKSKSGKQELEGSRGELQVRIEFVVKNTSQSMLDLTFSKMKTHTPSLKRLAKSVGHKMKELSSSELSLREISSSRQQMHKNQTNPERTFNFSSVEEGIDEEADDVSNLSFQKEDFKIILGQETFPPDVIIDSIKAPHAVKSAEKMEQITTPPVLHNRTQQTTPKNLSEKTNKIFVQGNRRHTLADHEFVENPKQKNFSTTNIPSEIKSNIFHDTLSAKTPISTWPKKLTNNVFRYNLNSKQKNLGSFRFATKCTQTESYVDERLFTPKSETAHNEISSPFNKDMTQDYMQFLTKEDLLKIVASNEKFLEIKDKKILELEQYIDKLLLKIITRSPNLLEY